MIILVVCDIFFSEFSMGKKNVKIPMKCHNYEAPPSRGTKRKREGKNNDK